MYSCLIRRAVSALIIARALIVNLFSLIFVARMNGSDIKGKMAGLRFLFFIAFCGCVVMFNTGCKKCKDGYEPCSFCEDQNLQINFRDSLGNCKAQSASDLRLFLYDATEDSLKERSLAVFDCNVSQCKFCFFHIQDHWVIFESISESFSDTIEILEYRYKPEWFFEENCCSCSEEIEYMKIRINQTIYEGDDPIFDYVR